MVLFIRRTKPYKFVGGGSQPNSQIECNSLWRYLDFVAAYFENPASHG